MAREMFNLRAAAEHIHVDANELKHAAQRGEIAAEERGGEWWIEHKALDEWAQRDLLAVNEKALSHRHESFLLSMEREARRKWRIAPLFRLDATSVELRAKTKGGIIRDMTDLAIASGLVYDTEGLFHELVERENAAPTAVGCGAAFLHPRYHDPYFFEDTFLVYGRAKRSVYFGAPDGEGTRHFFMICCTDHEKHLAILARLAVLAHGSPLMQRLDEVQTNEEALSAIAASEDELMG